MIKSPFNYIGGKFKLLPQILPHFPNEISRFYDVFGGGCNVGLNVNAASVYYNDIVPYVGEVFSQIKGQSTEDCLSKIDAVVNEYGLSKENEAGFLALRDDYNGGNTDWVMFYVLTCYSFNYQYRFNNAHKYNSSFGRNRSSFNEAMRKRFVDFVERLNSMDVTFDCQDFRAIDFSKATANDLVYFDPPYLITTGNYNDGKRGFRGWNGEDERDLHRICDELTDKNIWFALSNVTHHKGLQNDQLIEWSRKYNVIELNHSYANASYQAKNTDKKTVEVLITNFKEETK